MVEPMQGGVIGIGVSCMPIRRDRTGRWRYREVVSLPDGSRRRINGSAPNNRNTRAGAQQAFHKHLERLRAPGQGTVTKRKEVPVFEVFADLFLGLAANSNKPSEVESKRSIFEVHLKPAFSGLRLDQIGYSDVQDYVAVKLAQKKSKKTVNNHLTVLRRLLVVAKKRGLIEAVPEIEWLKPPKPEFDFLEFDEAERLVHAAEGQWRTMIHLAVRTGLRMGELLALRWSDVDLEKGQIRVCRSVSRGVVTTPKSGRSREVPLCDDVLQALKAYRHLRSDLVFCTEQGGMLNKNRCKHPIRRACRRAGLRRIGWHVLRHTFASHLVMKGAPLKAVQELLGHATIEMTMRYAHLSPSVRRDAVKLLDDHSWQKMAKTGS